MLGSLRPGSSALVFMVALTLVSSGCSRLGVGIVICDGCYAQSDADEEMVLCFGSRWFSSSCCCGLCLGELVVLCLGVTMLVQYSLSRRHSV